MSREFGRKGAALLAVATLLGGCLDRRDWRMADAGSGGLFHAAWGGTRSDRVEPSGTTQRLLGIAPPVEPLQVDPGNVWPVEEAPRATLADPDAALRGVPPWRPSEGRSGRDLPIDGRPGGPLVQPRADAAAPPTDDQRPPPRRRRGASSPPPPPLEQPEPSRVDVLPVPPDAYAPPPPRADGRVVLTPGVTPGGLATTTGGTPNVQSFTTPGGGSGVIHRGGGVTTVVPSGGVPQSFPGPR